MKKENSRTAFTHIGTVIDDVLKTYGREADGQLLQVWRLWEGVVGAPIAANARPAAFKSRILLVHVTSSAWIHQLQFLKKDIIVRLNRALGKALIDDLKLKIGPL